MLQQSSQEIQYMGKSFHHSSTPGGSECKDNTAWVLQRSDSRRIGPQERKCSAKLCCSPVETTALTAGKRPTTSQAFAFDKTAFSLFVRWVRGFLSFLVREILLLNDK